MTPLPPDTVVLELLIALLGCAGTLIMALAAFILKGMATDLKDLAHNSTLLNERLAVTVERVDSHDQRITRLEKQET